jgi:hypothetical protein
VRRWLVLAGAVLFAFPAVARDKVPRDPLGLDPGPEKTEAAFRAWATDPRTAPLHPLDTLRYIVHTSAKLRPDYYAFVFKQTGLTGQAAKVTRDLAELVNERAPLANQAPATRELQKQDADLAKKLLAAGAEWFKLVPPDDRIRVYKVAEKFSDARLAVLDLVRNGATVIDDSWIDQTRAEEARRQDGYLYGMCNGANFRTVQAVLDDFKLTVAFLLTFAGPPPYVHGDAAKNKVRAAKRAERGRILRELTPITL